MPLFIGNFYGPGGTDVPVVDGGTGASTNATARTNLGVDIYDSATFDTEHDAVDHGGAPFSLLDETAHDALDHAGLPGVINFDVRYWGLRSAVVSFGGNNNFVFATTVLATTGITQNATTGVVTVTVAGTYEIICSMRAASGNQLGHGLFVPESAGAAVATAQALDQFNQSTWVAHAVLAINDTFAVRRTVGLDTGVAVDSQISVKRIA